MSDECYKKYLNEGKAPGEGNMPRELRTDSFIAEVDTENEAKEIIKAARLLLKYGVDVANKKGYEKVEFRIRFRGPREGLWGEAPKKTATRYVVYSKW